MGKENNKNNVIYYKVSELFDYGLSKYISNKYKHLYIIDFLFINSLFIISNEISDTNLKKILDSIGNIKQKLNIYVLIEKTNEYFQSNINKLITKEVLKNLYINFLKNDELEFVISRLITSSIIKEKNNNFISTQSNIQDLSSFSNVLSILEKCVDSFIKNKYKEIFYLKFGLSKNNNYRHLTFEELGKENNITKQAVSQIFSKILLKIKIIDIDLQILENNLSFDNNYIKTNDNFIFWYSLFRKYKISSEFFINFSNLGLLEYNLLIFFIKLNDNINLNKRIEEIKIIEFYKNDDVEKFIINKYNLFQTNDGNLEKNYKNNLVANTLIGKEEPISSSEICKIINKNNNLKIQKRYIENIGASHPKICCCGNHKYKLFLDILNLNELNLIKNILLEYKGLYNLKFFMKNKLLFNLFLKEKIFDENQLHSFINKKIMISENKIKLERMPMILIGYKRKDDFYKSIIFNNPCITHQNLVNFLNKKYGMNKQTINSNIRMKLLEFWDGKYYRLELKKPTDEILNILKSLLGDKKFLNKKDFLSLMTENKIDERYFSGEMLYKLNYKIENEIIYKNGISGRVLVLEFISKNKTLQKKDLNSFFIKSKDSLLFNLQKECLIFRIDKNTYVPFNSICYEHFNKEIMINFINDILDILIIDEYIQYNQIILSLKWKYKFLEVFEENWINEILNSSGRISIISRKYSIFSNIKNATWDTFVLSVIHDKNSLSTSQLQSLIIKKYCINISYEELYNICVSLNSLKFINFDRTYGIIYKN